MGLRRRLAEAIWGVPKQTFILSKSKTAVLGTVEQTIGMYQTPSFMEMNNVFQNDPLIKEAITMFAEQVCATGIYLTANPKYTTKLNGKTALEVIEDWRNLNNLDIKLLEIAIEMKAFGNCIAKGSRIFLNSEIKAIEDVKEGDYAYTLDNGRFVKNRVLGLKSNGIKDIYKLKTRTRTLELTDNHPLLTPNGWKQLKELKAGDYIAVFNGYDSDKTEDKELIRFLGMYVGDGYTILHKQPFKGKEEYESGWVALCIFEPKKVEYYSKILYNLTGKKPTFRKGKGLFLHDVDFVKKIRSLGFVGKCKEKRVPSWIFQLNKELREEFIKGYVDSDGYVDKHGDYRFECSNENLLRDIRDLAISVGKRVSNVYSRKRSWNIKNQYNKTYEGTSTSWGFVIFNRLSKGKRLWNVEYKTFNGVFFDRISNIEYLGKKEVFDIQMEHAHNFIAEGIVVHNSFWRITDNGFVKIPIEAVWRVVPVESDVALQEKYNLQLTPLYGAKIIEWGEFMHFRVGVTGYKAPLGKGVLYSLLARPTDRFGNLCPSIYDIRLSMRSSLDEGFRKFSFGNELWCFPDMSNEDFKAPMDNGKTLGENIANMSNTGNRIATNTRGDIKIAVPERTQSYDQFIKQMRDEFFMALADPSLKLGLEEGFTKATSVTASEIYKFKVATMRRQIKEHFEDLFEQILDRLGYDGRLAAVKMNFGPEESAIYEIKDVFEAVKIGVITSNEARALLSKYHKWDIVGDVEGGDVPRIISKTGFVSNINEQKQAVEENLDNKENVKRSKEGAVIKEEDKENDEM